MDADWSANWASLLDDAENDGDLASPTDNAASPGNHENEQWRNNWEGLVQSGSSSGSSSSEPEWDSNWAGVAEAGLGEHSDGDNAPTDAGRQHEEDAEGEIVEVAVDAPEPTRRGRPPGTYGDKLLRQYANPGLA